ncbi:MAG TPA: site-specific integrase [Steroidobacteraceae bacterium]|nr:site-specific integrase [Steroidobacteraceae bacterium]
MPVRKRPDSPFWQIQIGRKTRFSSGTEDYDKAVELERAEKDRLWQLEKLGDRAAISWREAAERWLNSSARPKRRDREILAWLEKRIERSDTVAEVADPDALEELRKDGLADGWSHSTIDRMMTTVSAVLHACVDWRILDREPAVPMYRPPSGEPRWLTPAEAERLFAELSMHQALAARFAAGSMLRMRAMGRLEWSRVDFRQRRAWVPSSQQKAGRTFSFPLTDELVRVLRALRMIAGPHSRHVFTWRGQPIDDFNTKSFQDAVKRAGVAPFRWHDWRHTGASWAVQSGVTLQEIMVLGDWRDYRSVLRYAHLAPSQAASAADRVARWAHAEMTRKPKVAEKRIKTPF